MFEDVTNTYPGMHAQIVLSPGCKADFKEGPSIRIIETDPVLQGSQYTYTSSKNMVRYLESLPANKIILTEVSNV